MRVKIVSPPSEKLMANRPSYPLGLAYLGRALEDAGHEVEAYDFFTTPLEKISIRALTETDVLGLSCLTWNRVSTFRIIKEAKKINPKLIVVVGGVHPQTLWKQMMENLPIDYICIGESDKTIVELMEAIEKKRELKSIKGIVYRDKKNKKLVFTGQRDKIKDLDTIPFPRLDYFLNSKSREIYMITSRGCAFNCSFCSTTKYWQGWRAQSPERTVDEIEYWLKKFPKIKRVMFHDDQFCLDNQRVIDICKLIIKRKLKFTWTCCCRVTPVSDEMLTWMKKAGCKWITYGGESGSQQQLDSMNKRITLEQIRDTFKRTKAKGIKPTSFMVVGTPGENEKTVAETARFMDEIGARPKVVELLEIYPNTDIYALAKSKGLLDDSYWMTDNPVPIYTAEHSIKELRQMANYIILYIAKKHKFELVSFVAKHFIKHPIRTVKKCLEVAYG
ncbi:B12-binding domain-containing radical SAM protein [Candidatus Woesearchaeota archaeon]|nr:B12-binding domain-containing radical SAM protein [Candidatus Woesearchaeota archaeon]